MKKLLKAGMLLVAISAFMLGGCSTSGDSAEATTEAVSQEIVIPYSNGLTEEGKLDGVVASDIVTLCDYKNIVINKADVEPAEEEVDAQISNIVKSYGEYEGTVKKGDTVNIDYSGSIDGEVFDGGTASSQFLEIGSGSFIDNFEDQIIGHTPGDAFDVTVTFPKEYQAENLAGKEAVFSVTLNYIVPELSDEFVAKNFSASNGISTVEELKKAIRDNIRTSNEDTYIWNYLMENCTFAEIPDTVMDARLQVSVDAIRKQYNDYMGYDDEQILGLYNVESMDELKETLREDTENNVKYYLIATAICEEQNMAVTEEALNKFIGEAYLESYYKTYDKPYVNAQVMVSMTSDYLIQNATVK